MAEERRPGWGVVPVHLPAVQEAGLLAVSGAGGTGSRLGRSAVHLLRLTYRGRPLAAMSASQISLVSISMRNSLHRSLFRHSNGFGG